MIYAGIDVAKDRHDCLTVDSDGKIFPKYLPSPITNRVLTNYS